MYRTTIAVVDNPTVIDVDSRKLARGIYELGLAYPDQLEVSVETVAAKLTKFKNLPEQGEAQPAVTESVPEPAKPKKNK